MNTRFALLLMVLVGVALHFIATWGAYHPQLHISRVPLGLLFVYLLTVPFLLWFLHRDRPLRIIAFCVWLAYVALWIYAARTM